MVNLLNLLHLQFDDSITWNNRSTGDNFRKETFSRHNTVTGGLLDGAAAIMTFFANLGDLDNNRVAYLQFVTDSEFSQINTPCDNIFGKGTFFKRRQNLLYQINTLCSKQ